MTRLRIVVALVAASSLIPVSQANAVALHLDGARVAAAAVDYNGVVSPGHPFAWQGTVATGANTSAFVSGDPECGKDPTNYCDSVLIRFDFPIPDSALPAPGTEPKTVVRDTSATVSIGNYAPFPASDFDLFPYSSDADGTKGDPSKSSGNNAGQPEKVTVNVESAATVYPDGHVVREESTYWLFLIPYFTVPQSNYAGTAAFAG